MKILIISNLYPPLVLGGYEILCSQVVHELIERGHQLTVLTSTHGVEGVDDFKESAPYVHRIYKLYLPFIYSPKLLRHRRWIVGRYNYELTRQHLQHGSPDLIFIWSQLRLTVGPARAALNSGIPTAFSFNDEHIGEFMPYPLRRNLMEMSRYIADNWIYPSITLKGMNLRHTTCISNQLKKNLLKKGMDIEDSQVIYQGIPIEQFPPKQQMGDLHSPVRALYVGQLHSYKGVHNFINASHIVAEERGVNFLHSTIVGGGNENYTLDLMKLAKSGPAVVNFIGRIAHSSLPEIYREHDIFVFSSIWQEPFGLTHLEAMASGTPVISTADGGQGEFLVHNENCLIYEKENDRQLANYLIRMAQDEQLRRRLALTARKTVEERFTLQRYMDRLERFLVEAEEGG